MTRLDSFDQGLASLRGIPCLQRVSWTGISMLYRTPLWLHRLKQRLTHISAETGPFWQKSKNRVIIDVGIMASLSPESGIASLSPESGIASLSPEASISLRPVLV